MPFNVKTLSEIREDQLRDIKNQRPDVDVTPDSDYYVRASATSSAIEGLYEHQAYITRQIFPDSADEENLRRHAALRRLYPKSAATAAGKVRVSGLVGASVGSGQTVVARGNTYLITSPATIGPDSTAIVAATAVIPGSESNLPDNTPGQFAAAPAGVASEVVVLEMKGGLAAETTAQLLSRLLERLASPPAGGNVQDYRSWAKEIAGITDAYVFPHRSGVGSVDVAVISGNGLPSNDQVARAQLNIDLKRPAAARLANVFVPTIKIVDFVIAVSGDADLSLLAGQLETEIGAYFDSLAPGQAMIKSRIEAIVSNAAGVQDRRIDLPIGNVGTVVNAAVVEWLRLGKVTLVPMT